MRIPRLSLRRRSGNAPAETKAPVARAAADEDAGILRRTRLRLMLVSGLVTLVILVVLGAAVYLTVSDRVENGARAQLEQVALDQVDPDNPYGFSVEGKTAGLIPIVVAPDGTVRTTPGLAAASRSAISAVRSFEPSFTAMISPLTGE